MQITVDTREYENSHGQAPHGYGQWIFRHDSTGNDVPFHGTYAEAKRKIREAQTHVERLHNAGTEVKPAALDPSWTVLP